MTTVACVHYWIIDRMNMGTCKYCNCTKQFPRLDEIVWGELWMIKKLKRSKK